MSDGNVKRVLVLGATGMAGHVIFEYLQRPEFNFSVQGTARFDHPDLLLFDATWSADRISKFFNHHGPFDAVVNGIGCLVRASLNRPELALRLNALLPRQLESIFHNSLTKVIHISTDCVFDGKKGGSYSVRELPTERSAYGFSKSLGEISNSKDWTIRTSIIGPELANKPSASNNSGLLNWFLTQDKGSCIKGYTKAFWSGISTLELAEVIAHSIFDDHCGIQQISRQSKISKFDLLCIANEVFDRGLIIEPCGDKSIDKSLVPCEDAPTQGIRDSYRAMLCDIRDRIAGRSYLYSYNNSKPLLQRDIKFNFSSK